MLSPDPERRELARISACATLAVETGVPITMGIIATNPGGYEMLELIDRIAAAGGRMIGQSHCRGINVLLSFTTRLPFDLLPEWQRRPGAARSTSRLRALRDPAVRERLVDAGDARRLLALARHRRDAPQARLRRHPRLRARPAAEPDGRRGRARSGA